MLYKLAEDGGSVTFNITVADENEEKKARGAGWKTFDELYDSAVTRKGKAK